MAKGRKTDVSQEHAIVGVICNQITEQLFIEWDTQTPTLASVDNVFWRMLEGGK